MTYLGILILVLLFIGSGYCYTVLKEIYEELKMIKLLQIEANELKKIEMRSDKNGLHR